MNCHICKGTGQMKHYSYACRICKGTGIFKPVTLYRYIDIPQEGVTLRLEEWKSIKNTPSGYWIDYYKPKFINTSNLKQWAYPTKEAALISYYKRKEKQIQILKAQLERAETALKLTPENPSSEP